MAIYYKLTNSDGTAFYDNKTKYEVGKTLRKPECKNPKLCTSKVFHASPSIQDALAFAKFPLAIFKVEGEAVVSDTEKAGFFSLRVLKQITPTNKLFGFNYTEVCNPVNPCDIEVGDVTESDIANLKKWTSIGTSVEASIRNSVWDSIGISVKDSLKNSVWKSVWESLWDSVTDLVWESVWDSVWSSVYAYIGSLFPTIKKWKGIKHKKGEYPFQSAVNLWMRGIIPVLVSGKWKLYHPMRDGKAVKIWESE